MRLLLYNVSISLLQFFAFTQIVKSVCFVSTLQASFAFSVEGGDDEMTSDGISVRGALLFLALLLNFFGAQPFLAPASYTRGRVSLGLPLYSAMELWVDSSHSDSAAVEDVFRKFPEATWIVSGPNR